MMRTMSAGFFSLGPKKEAIQCVALASIAVIIYALMFGRYRAFEVDDAWTAAYAWTLVKLHRTQDTVFGTPSTIQYFGSIYLYLIGSIADIFGWKKETFHAINHMLIAASSCCWYVIAKKISEK